MAGPAKKLTLDEQDARYLKDSYELLFSNQRKNLTLLKTIADNERNKWSGEESNSRLAFIVTPLMVNHYNHMHQVLKSSVYGKMPDLCDQTGGIVCTDMRALREKLAPPDDTETTDDRSAANVVVSSTLSGLRVDLKPVRDEAFREAIRILDSIDIKHPDLTHSIRDDYIQNVRAIQEALTGVLVKSRDRTAELETQLKEAERKLKTTENVLASVPDEMQKLQNEVAMLRGRNQKLVNEISRRRVNTKFEELEKERLEREKELLQKVNNYVGQGSREFQEFSKRILTELTNARSEFSKLRNDAVRTVLDSVRQDRNEVMGFFSALSSKGDGTENANVARALSASVERDSESTRKQLEALSMELNNCKTQFNGLRERSTSLETENAKLKQRISQLEAEAKARMDSQEVVTVPERGSDERVSQLQYNVSQLQRNNDMLNHDLILFANYLSATKNIEFLEELKNYLTANKEYFKSDISEMLINLYNSLNGDSGFFEFLREKRKAIAQDEWIRSGIPNAYEDKVIDREKYIQHLIGMLNTLLEMTSYAFKDIMRKLEIEIPDNFNDYFSKQSKLQSLIDTFSMGGVVNPILEKIEYLQVDRQDARTTLQNQVDQVNLLLHQNEQLRLEVEKLKEEKKSLMKKDSFLLLEEKEKQTGLVDFFLNKEIHTFRAVLEQVWNRPDTKELKAVLTDYFYITEIDRIETYKNLGNDLKLCHLIDYAVVKRLVDGSTDDGRLYEPPDPSLKNGTYFLDYFLEQIGNVHVENALKNMQVQYKNRVARNLFEAFYIPIINKASFVMSIEGPFANFNMVYKNN